MKPVTILAALLFALLAVAAHGQSAGVTNWKRMIGTNVYDLRPVMVEAMAKGKSGGKASSRQSTNGWRSVIGKPITATRGGLYMQGMKTGETSVEGRPFYYIRNAPVHALDSRGRLPEYFSGYCFTTTNQVQFTYAGGTRTAQVLDHGVVVKAETWFP